MPRRRKGIRSEANIEIQGTKQNGFGQTHPASKMSTSSKKVSFDELMFNQKFAKQYEDSKRRQFLSNAPASALESDESSSSSEEEDEFGELLTKGIDRRVNETIEAIRSKDPRIYDKSTKFFEDVIPQGADNSSTSDTDAKSDEEPVAGWDTIADAAERETPKMTMKDYVRESLLRDGRLSDDSEDDSEHPDVQEYVMKQKQDKHRNDTGSTGMTATPNGTRNDEPWGEEHASDFIGVRSEDIAFEREDGDDEISDDEDFFTKKEKTSAELEEEARDLESFMRKQSLSKSKQAGEDLLLHSYLEKETPDEKERFLRDFVLNNGWLDKNSGEAPKAGEYEIEIDTNHEHGSDADFEDEKEFDEDADNFEAQYNFRFEDPEGAQIVSHTRKIPDSMRRPDTRRKRAREARKLRKEREKAEKTEEIKRLKNIKKKEIQARLLAIQEAAGDGVDLTGIDLEGDFDPESFSKQMDSKFNDEYYSREDDLPRNAEVERPMFENEKRRRETGDDLPDDVRADVQRMTDAYYDLDFEDIVGGVPMRFNYKKVEPETFSMTAEEILGTDDKELNRMVSLKYLAPYRSNREVQKQAWKVRSRRQRRGLERNIDQEGDATESKTLEEVPIPENNDSSAHESSKRKRRRARSREKRLRFKDSEQSTMAEAPGHLDVDESELNSSNRGMMGLEQSDIQVHNQESPKKKKKRKRKGKSQGLDDQVSLPESRLKAYGLAS